MYVKKSDTYKTMGNELIAIMNMLVYMSVIIKTEQNN